MVAGLLVLAGVPLLIALLVGLIVALPLSMVLFRGLRGRLDAALARRGERRSTEREALRRGCAASRGCAGDAGRRPEPAVDGDSDQREAEQQPEPEPDRGER